MENYKNTIEEHKDGTVIPLNSEEQLHEKLNDLQIKHTAALATGNEAEVMNLEQQIDLVNEQLGFDEEKAA